MIDQNTFVTQFTKTLGKKRYSAAAGGLIVFIILAFNFTSGVEHIVRYIEQNFSPDYSLKANTITHITAITTFGVVGSFLLYYTILFNQEIFGFLSRFVDLRAALNFFIYDEVCLNTTLPKFMFVFTAVTGLIVHILFLYLGTPLISESPLEVYTTLMFPVAAVLLLFTIERLRRKELPRGEKKLIVGMLCAISALFLGLFGEEISWGQRVFHFDSFGIFSAYNFQNEINIHNFFNPWFMYIYPAAGIGVFFTLCALWFFPKADRSPLHKIFFPHPNMFYLAFLMACFAFQGHSEIYEELLALFCLLYSIRVHVCLLHYPQTQLQTTL